MPFVVEIAKALAGLPAQVRISLRDALQEITEVIAALPPGATGLSILRDEPLRLDLMGWRFWYQVDPEKGAVRVLKARRIRGE